MSDLVEQAFNALKTLPEADQERIASEIIDRVTDKTEWDSLIASPGAQAWLERAADTALKDYAKIAKKVSMQFVSVSMDNLLREGTYWDSFEALPEDVRKLAESNYRLWKDNPLNPGLRFKQIHPERPIMSFRVGMKHRTVGVEAPDGKVVWFWVGSFDTFKRQIGL